MIWLLSIWLPPPDTLSSTDGTQEVWDNILTGEGWVRSQVICWRESLALYKSSNSLCFGVHVKHTRDFTLCVLRIVYYVHIYICLGTLFTCRTSVCWRNAHYSPIPGSHLSLSVTSLILYPMHRRESTKRLTMAIFWRTFHYDGKFSLGWWKISGIEVVTPEATNILVWFGSLYVFISP
jgi:hypothetical protein